MMMPLSTRKILSPPLFYAPDVLPVNRFLYSFLTLSGDEEEDPPVNVMALTSTSRTLVISESRPTTDETSPPEQVTGHSTPVGSPRAPSPKKARIELGREASLLTGSSATPSMDDVRPSFIHTSRTFQPFRLSFVFVCCRGFYFLCWFLLLHFPCQPLMKEFIRLGTQFIGYRDHANKLEGILFFHLSIE
jgi:hypothetical protein